MKTRLPKVLLTALLSISSYTIQAAPYYDSINGIIAVETGSIAYIPESVKPTLSHSVAKDGEGTLTYTGTGTFYSSLYVREGEMQIGNGTTDTSIKFDPAGYFPNKRPDLGTEGRYIAMQIGGKDAIVRFNKANATSVETGYGVGGANGNGTLIIENGSNVDLSGANMFNMGDISLEEMTDPSTGIPDGYNNASTSSIGGTVADATDLYKGNYSTARNGSGAIFGRADILVTGNSRFNIAYGNVWMGEATLVVEGSGTVVQVGTAANGNRFLMGLGNESTAEVVVKNKAIMEIYAASTCELGYGRNSTALITVDGDSSLIVHGNGSVYMGWMDDGVNTQLSATNGSSIDFTDNHIYLGRAAWVAVNSSALVSTDDSSRINAKKITMEDGGSIRNNGQIQIAEFVISGGSLTNDGIILITDKLKLDNRTTVSLNLTSANQQQAILTLGKNATVETGEQITFNVTGTENIKSGTSFVLLSNDNQLQTENITLTGTQASIKDVDGVTVITLLEDIFVARDPLADVLGAAAWGVQKSSQAFTGTLWGGRTNAVVLNTTYDAKGGALPVAKTIAWGTAYGQFSEINSCCDAAGTDYNIYGAAIGAEHQFASGRSIGAAIGYDWGKVSPFHAAAFDQESKHAAMYGRAAQWMLGTKGVLAVDLAAAVGQTESELPAGDVEQDSLQLNARVSYIRSISDKTSVSAFAGLQYYAQSDDATANVKVGTAQYLRTLAGVGINHAVTAKATVFAEASVYNDAMRHNPEVIVDGFSYGVANPGRLGGTITAGAAYDINDEWTLRGSYSFDAAKHSTEHSVNAGAIYKF